MDLKHFNSKAIKHSLIVLLFIFFSSNSFPDNQNKLNNLKKEITAIEKKLSKDKSNQNREQKKLKSIEKDLNKTNSNIYSLKKNIKKLTRNFTKI